MIAVSLPGVSNKASRIAFGGGRLTELLGGSFGSVTNAAKAVYGNLGKSLGYQIAAADYPGADNAEWLRDMVW